MSFGWTVKIYNPVWIHFGPGVTGKMYYGKYQSKKYPTKGYGEDEWDRLEQKEMGDEEVLKTAKGAQEPPEKYKDGWTHANFAAAISPVIGITAKYSYFAIRLTYQYRWSLEKNLADFIGKDRLCIGFGVAF